jgi:hypothetical protein
MILVCNWIKYVERLGVQFPSNFNFSFYLDGLKKALDIDHSVAIPRTLWCIYNTLHYYPAD